MKSLCTKGINLIILGFQFDHIILSIFNQLEMLKCFLRFVIVTSHNNTVITMAKFIDLFSK